MTLLTDPSMTARQLAEKLLALPNPDAPVFAWAPGQYWEIEPPQPHTLLAGAWIMLELNRIDTADVRAAAKEHAR